MVQGMAISDVHKHFQAKMTDAEFATLSSFIFQEFGIKMPLQKKLLLQGRLRSRLNARKIDSFTEYINFLFSSEGKQIELVNMIDVVTTNKTDFFREPEHFDFLYENILTEKLPIKKHSEVYKVWSAGCSTGEEPYTIAIILSEFKALHPDFDFHIYATDISTRVLQFASQAVYPESKAAVIPLSMKKNYLLKHKDAEKKDVRIVPSIRSKITFERHNLMEIEKFRHSEFDLIFCRNTLIYFDRKTQIQVLGNLCNKLKKSGYLIIGHSESILDNNILPLQRIKPTIYSKVVTNKTTTA
jgi:chemotaxis protein methyltransferase CheR